jgi:hypothetical protein
MLLYIKRMIQTTRLVMTNFEPCTTLAKVSTSLTYRCESMTVLTALLSAREHLSKNLLLTRLGLVGSGHKFVGLLTRLGLVGSGHKFDHFNNHGLEFRVLVVSITRVSTSRSTPCSSINSSITSWVTTQVTWGKARLGSGAFRYDG